MNTQMTLGVALNLLIGGAAWAELGSLGMLFFAVGLAGALGLALVALGQRKAGAWLVFGSGCLFVPLGMVAALGARKCLDQIAREQFEASAPRVPEEPVEQG